MRLYIVRHGHKASQEPDYDGGFNTPLSDVGRRQAQHLAEFLAGEEIDTVYASCQLRALQTAQPVSEAIDGDWHVWPVFYEGTGKLWAEQHAENPDDARWATAWRAGERIESPGPEELDRKDGNYYLLSDIPDMFPGAQVSQPFPFPDAWWELKRGYTKSTGYARADLGTEALLHRLDDGERAAIICHSVIATMLVTVLMDFPRRTSRFSCENTGVHRLDRRDDEQWRVTYTNRICHLPPELRR